ncbi:hypothetical protein RvY_17977 [Ramazzottius varieornatus]|uniref:Uncharacterized protein n=1 Tax=Ramazzottius varieornatus TaxID=947166 RepID=A0A1D1W9M9_RAMVA|nr:hypothetical protein RvY_17977 [Ramazzottius varieornatus]
MEKSFQETVEDAWKLVERIRAERLVTPKSELKCVNCDQHPIVYHTEEAQREFEEISQLCGVCLEVVTLPPDSAEEDTERAKNILKLQDREYFYHPRGWKCLKCLTKFQPHKFGKEFCRC